LRFTDSKSRVEAASLRCIFLESGLVDVDLLLFLFDFVHRHVGEALEVIVSVFTDLTLQVSEDFLKTKQLAFPLPLIKLPKQVLAVFVVNIRDGNLLVNVVFKFKSLLFRLWLTLRCAWTGFNRERSAAQVLETISLLFAHGE